MAVGTVGSTTHSESDFDSLFASQLAELKALEEISGRTQFEIDRIKSETALLKREGQALEAETLAILARIKSLVS